MKKVLFLALGMLLIPFTAFGMQMMADSDMESITAQSGVAISLENVQVYNHQTGEEIWYETSGSAVGIVYEDDQSYSYLYVTTLDYTQTGADFDPSALARGDYTGLIDMAPEGMPQDPRVITIRVTNVSDSGDDRLFFDAGDVPYVEIGLPTLELYALQGSQEVMSIYVIGTAASNTAGEIDPLDTANRNEDNRIGRIHTTDGGATTAIFGGRVGITAYGNVPDANKNMPGQ